MCRILLAIRKKNATDPKLIEESCRLFAELADSGAVPKTIVPGHRDGWGAGFLENSAWKITKSMDHPRESSEYQSAVQDFLRSDARAFVVHLRKASLGNVILENVQPFTDGRTAFVHNGTVKGIETLIGKSLPEDSTDSKEIFRLIIQDMQDGASDVEALREIIQRAREVSGYYSLSSMLIGKNRAVIARDFDESSPQSQELCYSDYYTLYLGESESALFACSEALSLPGVTWRLLANQTISVIDIESATLAAE